MKRTVCYARKGLTLVELMIVVSVLGILAAIAIPTFSNANEEAVVSATASDFRLLAGAVERYYLKEGEWPADVLPGREPAELSDYLVTQGFTGEVLGSSWDYENWTGLGNTTDSGDPCLLYTSPSPRDS